MVDERPEWYDEPKKFNWRIWVMVALAVVVVVGCLFIGGSMACNRGDGIMSGLACVGVTNYGICELDGAYLIQDINGEPLNGLEFNLT